MITTDEFLGIDKSWIEAGLDIKLIQKIMDIIAQKRKGKEILPAQEDVLNVEQL